MSENGFSIVLQPSIWLKYIFWLTVILAALSILLTPVAWYWQLCLAAGLVSLSYQKNASTLLRRAKPITKIHYQATQWQLTDQHQHGYPAVLETAYISRFILMLTFYSTQLGRQTVTIAVDSAEKEQFRQLSMILRHYYRP